MLIFSTNSFLGDLNIEDLLFKETVEVKENGEEIEFLNISNIIQSKSKKKLCELLKKQVDQLIEKKAIFNKIYEKENDNSEIGRAA